MIQGPYGAVGASGDELPFSSLSDPVDVARAQAALDIAWQRIAAEAPDMKANEAARTQLAYLIAGLVNISQDEEELAERALVMFAAKRPS